jgi:hypothetical protein
MARSGRGSRSTQQIADRTVAPKAKNSVVIESLLAQQYAPIVVTVTDGKRLRVLRQERGLEAGSEPSPELKAFLKRMMRPPGDAAWAMV